MIGVIVDLVIDVSSISFFFTIAVLNLSLDSYSFIIISD